MVPSDQIEITVTKGWVTLKGEVEWQFQGDKSQRAWLYLDGNVNRNVEPTPSLLSTITCPP
jgi:osmotically-inducible protein OsmY